MVLNFQRLRELKFEEMIKDKGGFMKTQAFAMKMTEDAKWIDQIKEDPSMLELHYRFS